MRRDQYIDEIELNQPEAADNTPKVAGSDGPLGPGRVKPLCGERDTARRCQRNPVRRHSSQYRRRRERMRLVSFSISSSFFRVLIAST